LLGGLSGGLSGGLLVGASLRAHPRPGQRSALWSGCGSRLLLRVSADGLPGCGWVAVRLVHLGMKRASKGVIGGRPPARRTIRTRPPELARTGAGEVGVGGRSGRERSEQEEEGAAAIAALLRRKRASERVVGGRPPEPPLRPARSHMRSADPHMNSAAQPPHPPRRKTLRTRPPGWRARTSVHDGTCLM
jgi:hypothetical protein